MKIKVSLLAAAAVLVGITAWTVLGQFGIRPSQAQSEPVSRSSLLSKKLVWAHCMVSYPLDLDILYPYKPNGYSEMYPLYQEQGLEKRTGKRWQATDIEAAQAAGVDGFFLDIFNRAAEATPSLEAADKIPGFLIAPCLDLSLSGRKENDAFTAIDDYCHLAASHPSAARIGSAFLIFAYGTHQLSPQAWQRVRARLAAAGDHTYWVADCDIGGPAGPANGFPAALVTQYSALFEAGYCFSPPGRWWNDLVSLFGKAQKPFLGGMMPGYSRSGAGYSDAAGTAVYRQQWQQHLGSALPWVTISTWNDLQENTEITPSSDWNFTRADLTRWYSAKFKGIPEHWTQPQLYVTTPKTVYPNENARAEALVLNPLTHPVTASVQFFDSDKKPVGEPITVSIPAGQAQAATQLLPMSAVRPGAFLRAHAQILDDGRQIASVVSAPVLVLDPVAQPGFPTLYYSIPAARSLPAVVTVTHEDGQASFAYPARVPRRFAEALHNTALVKNALNGRTVSRRLPAQPDFGPLVQITSWGFDVARVTDDQFRVGYSDPLYTPPPAAIALREKYTFDEGDGSEITDLSPYHQTSQLVQVAWARPGEAGSPACVYFNGHTSRIDLTVGQTPTGPVSWKLSIRPSTFGSVLYADVGGFVVSLSKDGKVLFARHTRRGGPFVTAFGATMLTVGQWSDIRCTWDGQTSRIYVNGHLDAQTPCEPGFTSSRRSLGCNPFGQSSDYYNGDMDNFELSTQLP